MAVLKKEIKREVVRRLSANERPEVIANDTEVGPPQRRRTLGEKTTLFSELKKDLDAVNEAIRGVKDLLLKGNLTSVEIRKQRGVLVPEDRFKNGSLYPKRSQPHFLDSQYPQIPLTWEFSTHSEILAAVARGNPQEVLKLGTTASPLTRFLLAYIWKRGELGRLHYVARGILDNAPGLDSATADDRNDKADSDESTDEDSDGPQVMIQFGRHLKNRSDEPIVDQHTYRAFQVLTAERYIPSWAKSLNATRVKEYKIWWTSTVLPKFARDTRNAAMGEFDKLLFSLGKAIVLFPGAYD